jgi:hypothetical protein
MVHETHPTLSKPGRFALAALAVMLAVLIPRVAEVQEALLTPVRYAKVELSERAPAAISLGLPSAEYAVSPASLGYFAPNGDFVYTADVARGLVYGRPGGPAKPVYAVEIAAPEQADDFLEDQLEQIRRWTRELNTQRNKLRLARLERSASIAGKDAVRLAQQFWLDADDAAASVANQAWLERATAQGLDVAKELSVLLASQAERQALLKELFYSAEATRIELTLAQFHLQLALARLPRRSGPQLLPQPTSAQIAAGTTAELSGLCEVWRKRRDVLTRLIAVVQAPEPVEAEQLEVTSFLPGNDLLPQPGQTSVVTPPAPAKHADVRTGLALAAAHARTRVWQAEAVGLGQALESAESAMRHIATQAGQAQDELAHYAVTPALLGQPTIDTRSLSAVERLSADIDLTTGLLLKLSRLFEGGRGSPGPAHVEERLRNLRPRGQEVPCGLIAVDRCQRELWAKSPGELGHKLDAVFVDPDSYGVAALNLGYLRFIRWYAKLAPPEESFGWQPYMARDIGK